MDSAFTKVFVEIASCCNITKAAENLGYSQSGLSHTLNRAEDELGFKLFYRAKSGVTLTPEGEMLLPIAKELEMGMEKLYETISSIQGISKGRITIGTIQSISIHVLSPILKAFESDYPQIKIDLKEGTLQEIHDWILDHTVDLGLTSIQKDDEFESIPLYDDPMMAVVPMDYDLNGKDFIDVTDFDNKPFIMPSMEKDNDIDLDRVIKNSGINVNVKCTSKDDTAIMSMVEYGLGVSIIPELYTLRHFQNIQVVPLNPPYKRNIGIGLYSFSGASPATLKFIEYAKDMFTDKYKFSK
ncbi:MAG: LysR family transcriptional regulator [Clostridiales bacterium]|nr:LysR family transcriptional regulator [Clostridiales bacterium]